MANFKYLNQIVDQCVEMLGPTYTVYRCYGGQDEMPHNAPPTKNVAIFSIDHWGDDETLFVPLRTRPLTQLDKFKLFAESLPNHRFVIFSTVFKLNESLAELSNVYVIHWGDEMIMHFNSHYAGTHPQSNKNFSSTKHWINLNHNVRIYRFIVAAYLLGLQLTESGLLKIDPERILVHESWKTFTQYCKYSDNREIFKISDKFTVLSQGFEKMQLHEDYVKSVYQLGSRCEVNWDFPINFDQNLRHLYIDSFVEIVSETIFMQPAGLITEKFLNSVYGFNFPIIMNIPGTVEYLRQLGFDMFDDIIDHSYDLIKDPYPRMVAAIDNNKELLVNPALAKSCWRECYDRLHSNYLLADNLYSQQPNNVQSKLKLYLDQYPG